MRTLLGFLATLTVVATSLLGAGLVASASAQGLSAGCESLNHPVRDGLYGGAGFRLEFAAGERISIAAGLPTSVATPTTITLYVSPGDLENPLDFPGARVVVDTASFPGTLEYTFPAAGTHHVDWTAGFANVTWTVSCAAGGDPVGQLEGVAADLEAIVDAGAGTKLGDKAEDALAKLEAALAKLRQAPPDRQGALGEIEGAVGDLEAAVKDNQFAEGTDLLDRLAGAARLLAEEAIADAVARNGAADKIAEAERALQRGDAKRASGRFKDAVASYKDAVSKAEGAGKGGTTAKLENGPGLCARGQWQYLYTSTGEAFTDKRSCQSYASGGGTLAGILAFGRHFPARKCFFNPENDCWAEYIGFGLQPGSRTVVYARIDAEPYFQADGTLVASDGTASQGPMMGCGFGLTDFYVTGVLANGTPITSNIATAPC